jgi:hypothetical protein
MALNFPNSPTLNQVYTDSTSGFSYQWNGTVWISFSAASSSQIKTLDDISSGFNNSTQTFALTSGALSISPPTSQSLIINLGGVIQDATDDYSVSGSNIVFSTAPTNGLSFSGVSLGPAIPINTIPNGTVTDGSLTVAGLLSTTNLFVSGISTFIGLATHTGTIFGNNLSLTGVATASSFVGALTGTATTTTNIPNLTGAITSVNTTTSLGSFSSANLATALTDETGSGANVFATSPTLVNPSLGIATATSINVSSVVTATSFVGALTGTATTTTNIPNLTGAITSVNTTTSLGSFSSANLATALIDETGSGAAVFATSPTLVTPALGTPNSGILTSCTVDGTDAVGFRNIPQNSQSADYTLVLADNGKHIFHPVGDNNARTFTIPANSSVAYPIGTALTFINMAAAAVTIAITTDTLTLSSAGTAGSRTLAQYGSATAVKITSTNWIISGSGLT